MTLRHSRIGTMRCCAWLLALAGMWLSGCAQDRPPIAPQATDEWGDWGKNLRPRNTDPAPFLFSSDRAKDIDRSLGGR